MKLDIYFVNTFKGNAMTVLGGDYNMTHIP